jgi:S1-C subfamily serine protease
VPQPQARLLHSDAVTSCVVRLSVAYTHSVIEGASKISVTLADGSVVDARVRVERSCSVFVQVRDLLADGNTSYARVPCEDRGSCR